jgi:hypothetical protein
MESPKPPQFEAFASTLSSLTPFCESALGAQPIEAIIRVAKFLDQLTTDGDRLIEDLAAKMGGSASVLHLDDRLRGLQDQLAALLQLAKGHASESQPLVTLHQTGLQWINDLNSFTALLAAEQQRFEQRVRLRERLDGIGQALRRPCFRFGRRPWLDACDAAVQSLDQGAELTAVEEALQPLEHAWRDTEAARGLAAHYGAAEDWRFDGRSPDQPLSTWLNEGLTGIADWMARTEERLDRLELPRLPDVPTGLEGWFRGAVVLLAMHLEIRLAANRTANQRAIQTLTRLAALAEASRSIQAWTFDPSDTLVLQQPLELAILDGQILEGIDSAARILGEQSQALDLMTSLLVQAVQRDPLWRLPTGRLDIPTAPQALSLVRQAARQAAQLPRPVFLHVLAAGVTGPEEMARRFLDDSETSSALLALGPIGAWLVAGCLDGIGQAIDADRAEALFLTKDKPATASGLMPLVLLRSLRRDEVGIVGLLAALELLAHRRRPDFIPLNAVWVFSGRWSHDYPTLSHRLERLRANPNTSTTTSSQPDDPVTELQRAEVATQAAVRPRNYRGVRSVEYVSRLFVDEVAGRLLERAHEADALSALEKVRADVKAEREKVDNFLDRQTRAFLNPPEGRLRAALLRECEEMLEAIERYVELRIRHIPAGTLRTGGNRAELQRELEQLSRQGWAGREASRLLHELLLQGKPPALQLPGDHEAEPTATHWNLPRCLRAWQDMRTDLGDYLRCLHDDLTGKGPVEYALQVADRDGQLDFAEQFLREVPLADPAAAHRMLAGYRANWTELVTAELEELHRLAEPLGSVQDLADPEANIEQVVREGGFDVALRNLASLRELVQLHLAALNQPRSSQDLLDAVEQVLGRIYQAELTKEIKRDLRLRVQDLERRLETDGGRDEVRRQIDKELLAIAKALPAEGTTLPLEVPEEGEAISAPVVLSAGVEAAPPAVEPTHVATRHGIIKCMVGGQFGFIAPLAAGENDVFFHRNNLIGDLVPLGPALERAAGHLVTYELKAGSAPDRPPVKWCRLCVGQDAEKIFKQLDQQLGSCPVDVGILGAVNGQRAIMTDNRGFFAMAPGGLALPRGAIVCFDVIDEHDRLARVKGTPVVGSVTPERKKLLERLLGPSPTAPTLQPIQGAITAALLLQMRPGEAQAINLVRTAHERRLRQGEQWGDVAAALRDVRMQGRPEAIWWQAMFIYAELLDTDDPNRRRGLLRQLVERQREWATRNFDVVVAWLYRALRDFSADYPDQLTLEDVLTFLHELQIARGANPHFRLEVLQARLREALYDDQGRADDLRQALAHANHALILNPRLAEGALLRDALKRRAIQVRLGETPVSQAGAVSDRWPENPIEAVAFIKGFYQREVIGPDGPRKARDFFEKNKDRATGVALSQLIQEHARHLQQTSKHLEAEQTVIGHLLAHKPQQGWQPLLRLLQDLWTGLGLPFDQMVANIDRVKPCVPEEGQYFLSLILARLAYHGGKYDLALRFAEESDLASSSAEAQQVIRRAQAMLGQVASTSLTKEERRDAALERIRRAADQDEGLGPIDLILDVMDDLEVGPWLVRRAIEGHCGIVLDEAESISLVRRAQGLAARPTPDLLHADVAVTWGNTLPFQQEGDLMQLFDASVLETILLQPDDPVGLDRVMQIIGAHRPWSAFVLLDCLTRFHEENVRLRWRRSICARNIQRKEDYVESALSCVGLLPEASFVRVANDLISLKLNGLALGMAALAHESNTLAAAERACRLEVWEWPSYLHEAKSRYANWEWAAAADRIIRVLMAAPEHWPACRVFSEIFTWGFEEDTRRRSRALELAEAVVRHLEQRSRRESPEMLVLQAELRHQREALRSDRTIQAGVIDELIALCNRAQQIRSGFRPAADLKNHLNVRGEARYAEGEQVGNFRMGRELGEGAFGRVYEATVIEPSLEFPEHVTLKFVRLDAGTPEKYQERVRSLEREARIALRFNHPHIVKTYSFMDLKGHKCLVMEFIDGFTLAEKIEKHSLMPWQFVASVAWQVAHGLEYAREEAQREPRSDDGHSRDFAHCDIHPRNIMVRNTEHGPQAKLLDFALARLPGASSMTSIVFKGINKRLYYRDPDYPRGGPRGDMFSLGVILYELLSGKPPYPIDRYYDYQVQQATPAELEAIRQPVGRLAPQGVEIPRGLEEILLRMVAFKRNQRYENWDKLIDALTPFVAPNRP